MNIESCFSSSYAEARGKFLAAAESAGAKLEHFDHPLTGPDGGSLHTDIAVLGQPDAARVVICTSATHGVEGFCGSGVQVGVLQSGLYKYLPDNAALVLCHALNPHGFAWERRVTEDNVDLNRNFIDFAALPPASAYEEVHEMLLPADWDGPAKHAADQAAQHYIQQHGMAAFQAAVSSGQYTHPDGLFYGGTAPTWSNQTWREILRQFGRGRKHLALLDLHTGLGPSGYGEPIADGDLERVRAWYGDEVTSTSEGTSTSADLRGVMSTAIAQEAPDTEITAMTLEFGTVPLLQVLEALRGDHWLHREGDPQHPLAGELKRRIREAFYVETPEWKTQVWERSNEMLRKAFGGIARV